MLHQQGPAGTDRLSMSSYHKGKQRQLDEEAGERRALLSSTSIPSGQAQSAYPWFSKRRAFRSVALLLTLVTIFYIAKEWRESLHARTKKPNFAFDPGFGDGHRPSQRNPSYLGTHSSSNQRINREYHTLNTQKQCEGDAAPWQQR